MAPESQAERLAAMMAEMDKEDGAEAPPAAEPPAPEAAALPVPEPTPEPAKPPEPPTEEGAGEDKGKKGRIQELIEQRRERETRIAELEAENARLRVPVPATPAPAVPSAPAIPAAVQLEPLPTQAEFTTTDPDTGEKVVDWDGYFTRKAEVVGRNAAKQERADLEAKLAKERREEGERAEAARVADAKGKTMQAFRDRMATRNAEVADFNESWAIVQGALVDPRGMAKAPVLERTIITDPDGVALADYLGRHPEDLRAAMTMDDRTLGRFMERWLPKEEPPKPNTPAVTKAPEPLPVAVGAGAGADFGPEGPADIGDYIVWNRRRQGQAP